MSCSSLSPAAQAPTVEDMDYVLAHGGQPRRREHRPRAAAAAPAAVRARSSTRVRRSLLWSYRLVKWWSRLGESTPDLRIARAWSWGGARGCGWGPNGVRRQAAEAVCKPPTRPNSEPAPGLEPGTARLQVGCAASCATPAECVPILFGPGAHAALPSWLANPCVNSRDFGGGACQGGYPSDRQNWGTDGQSGLGHLGKRRPKQLLFLTVLSTEADAHVAASRSRTPRTLTRTVIR
jgi:hypothetical protein